MPTHPSTRILLIGLAGAGKTALGMLLGQRLDLTVTRLDDLRRALSDGTEAGDARARGAFLQACGLPEPAIYEFSGAGSHRAEVRHALSTLSFPLVTAWIDTPADVRRERLDVRTDPVPLPSWGARALGVEETMAATLRSDFEAGWWAECPGWRALRLDGTHPLPELVALVERAWREAGGVR